MADQEIWYREFVVHYEDPKTEESKTVHAGDEEQALLEFERLLDEGAYNLAVLERMYRKITGTAGGPR